MRCFGPGLFIIACVASTFGAVEPAHAIHKCTQDGAQYVMNLLYAGVAQETRCRTAIDSFNSGQMTAAAMCSKCRSIHNTYERLIAWERSNRECAADVHLRNITAPAARNLKRIQGACGY